MFQACRCQCWKELWRHKQLRVRRLITRCSLCKFPLHQWKKTGRDFQPSYEVDLPQLHTMLYPEIYTWLCKISIYQKRTYNLCKRVALDLSILLCLETLNCVADFWVIMSNTSMTVFGLRNHQFFRFLCWFSSLIKFKFPIQKKKKKKKDLKEFRFKIRTRHHLAPAPSKLNWQKATNTSIEI